MYGCTRATVEKLDQVTKNIFFPSLSLSLHSDSRNITGTSYQQTIFMQNKYIQREKISHSSFEVCHLKKCLSRFIMMKNFALLTLKFASLISLLILIQNVGGWNFIVKKNWNVNIHLFLLTECGAWPQNSRQRGGAARPRARTCSNPKIVNGGVMPMFKGKMIKFSCNKDYQRYGDEYAECMNGRWSIRTFPICISEWILSASIITLPFFFDYMALLVCYSHWLKILKRATWSHDWARATHHRLLFRS